MCKQHVRSEKVRSDHFLDFKGKYSGPFFHIGDRSGKSAEFSFVCVNPPTDDTLLPLLEAYVEAFSNDRNICLYLLLSSGQESLMESLLQEQNHLIEGDIVPDIALLAESQDEQLYSQLFREHRCILFYDTEVLPDNLPLYSPEFIFLSNDRKSIEGLESVDPQDIKAIVKCLKQINTGSINIAKKLTYAKTLSQPVSLIGSSMRQTVIGLGLPAHLSLDSNLLLDDLITSLKQLPPTHTFCIAGLQGSARPLYERLKRESMLDQLDVYFDDHAEFNDVLRSPQSLKFHRSHLSQEPQTQWLVSYVPPQYEAHIMRFYLQNLDSDFHFLLPFASAGYYHQSAIEMPEPVLIHMFPCVGTNRLMPPLNAFLNHFQWEYKPVKHVFDNNLMIKLCDLEQITSPDYLQDYYLGQLRCLDFYQYTIIHDLMDLQKTASLPWLRKMTLIRDPRDVVTSFYFREFVPQFGEKQISEAEKEAHLSGLIENGFMNAKSNYVMSWPNITDISNMFVSALESATTLVVKFEDLHQQESKTYQKILDWLGFDSHPLLFCSEQQRRSYIHMGSFEYQTRGRLKRGTQDDKPFEQQGTLTACRKGVSGDWVNHFSSRLAQKCQDLIGDQLKTLGY